MSKNKLEKSIGYKSPPRAHQFQPGQSGNPAGRPKGARSLKADLRDELSELTRFHDGDQSLEVTKQRLLVKKLIAAAIDGDARATATVLSLAMRALGDEAPDSEESPQDREVMALFAARSAKRRPAKVDVAKQCDISAEAGHAK
jgi:hypothetical protein